MVTYVKGDATKPIGDGAKIIVHIVNDMGRWGAGFVLALNKISDRPYKEYKLAYEDRRTPFLPLGTIKMVWLEDYQTIVCNLVGQHGTVSKNNPHPVSYEAIEHGLNLLAEWIEDYAPAATVHMPRIGCGLAQGNWDVVESIINRTLTLRDVDVTVYDL
jgi:O-acetyl-ADP-ribose deacetylase (regulator of RNase III)